MDGLAPFLGPAWVEAGQTIGEAASAILRGQLSAILARREGTLAGQDPQELHQMRVACRRLRTAVGLFRRWLPEGAERLREEAGWISSVLGPVRDADVQLEALRVLQDSWPEDIRPSVEAFVGWIAAGRAEAFGRMAKELTSDRWTRFGELVLTALPPGHSPEAPPVEEAGAIVIRKRYRRVRRLVRALDPGQPDEAFHAARIAAKKARYAMEFLAPVFGPDSRACAKRIAELQDHLGLLQDRAVVRSWLRLAQMHLPEHSFALGYLTGWFESESSTLKQGVRGRWRPVREAWRRLERQLPEAEDRPPESPAGPV